MKVWIEKCKVSGRSSRIDGDLALGKALWSPIVDRSGADRYRKMREPKKDDIVLHLTDNKCFSGISLVSSSFKMGQCPDDDEWMGEAYIVPLKGFKKLNPPLNREDLLNDNNREILNIAKSKGKVFYDKNLDLNQGAYFTEAPNELANLINDVYQDLSGNNLPYFNNVNEDNLFYKVLKKAEKRINQVGFRLKSLKSKSRYVWVEDKNNIIGRKIAHYEFISRKGILRTELHFEDQHTKNMFYENIKNLPENLEWFNWSGAKSIRHKNEYKLFETSISNKIVEDIIELDKLIGEQIRNLITNKISSKEHKNIIMKDGLNLILYGPPGTGKTYTLKNEYFPKYTITGTSLSKEENFKDVVAECTWFEVIAIALIEEGKSKVSKILKNRWVDQKYKMSKAKSPRELIWGTLGYHTLESCEFVNNTERSNVTVFLKDQFSYWEISMKDAEEKIPEIFEIIDKVKNYVPKQDIERKNYSFITFHQSYSYEDFIEGIKPVMDNKSSSELTEIGYEIKDGIFKILCKKAEENPKERFAIFIDEINRGNVSSIFGELITLIEIDKRKGKENEISVILPYSKEEFSIPPNIDIYGTMNTADRSVEALDTALRRRFSFKEMMPDAEKLSTKEINGINLKELLNIINSRIEILIDRDHKIGHSYFIGLRNLSDLKNVFKNKIIPLLQEYFYGDYGKIGLVLGKGFVNFKNKSTKPFASFNYDGKEDLNKESYNLVIIDENFNIKDALNLLYDFEEID